MTRPAAEENPTLIEALVFGFKASCFRLKRKLEDSRNPVRKFPATAIKTDWPVLAESRTVLYSSTLASEFGLQAGKVHNLRVAARYLNGVVVESKKPFSFWRHVPRPSSWRGFSKGRELREGCIIPSVGGGLCQLSNALYDCALRADLEIIERHGHSRTLPGSMAEVGRDATVFWNYVDLRLQSKNRFQIEVLLGRGELILRFRSDTTSPPPAAERHVIPPGEVPVEIGTPVESCETCGVTSCFRHPQTLQLPESSHTAWLVDAYWPEHDRYLTEHRKKSDWLFCPAPAKRYGWNRDGFARRTYAPVLVAWRSLASRRLARQGAERQRTLLAFDEKLARSYARRIPASALHVVVSQNLLPFLWKSGALGGRTFDVLMTRLPLVELQATLDEAAQRWPESTTLADFRADPELLQAEADALAEAAHWITPHSKIARLAGEKAIHLDWKLPDEATQTEPGKKLLFPASTLGRKGARELRELNQPLAICGPVLEESNFWDGVPVTHQTYSLDGVGAVLLPAWVENQPRRLLQAVAAGVPVIASEACGLEGVSGVTSIPRGDTNALSEAIRALNLPS